MPSYVRPGFAGSVRAADALAETLTSKPLTRRRALALGALLPAGAVRAVHRSGQFRLATTAAAMPPFTEPAELIVAGPENGRLEPWAQLVKKALDAILPPEQAVRVAHVGGNDGVTAANQFEARISPDGVTTLLISGAPAIAWLMGDPRTQFDAGHWLPVATGLVSGVVLGRSMNWPPKDHARLATSGRTDLALAAALGLSLLKIPTDKAVELEDPVAALLAGQCDAVFLCGTDAVSRARTAQAAGAVAIFSLGVIDDTGALIRDPLLAEVPTLPELIGAMQGAGDNTALITAWRAAAAAAQLEFALLLPWLTPPGIVAWWRNAGAQIAATLQPTSTPQMAATPNAALRLHADPTSNFGLSAITTDANASLALHRWLMANSP